MGFLKALCRPYILLLWVSQVFSSMGDYLYELAVVWIAVKSVGSSAGLVAAAEAGSQLVFGLLGGVYADRWDRRKVMVSVDITRAITVTLLSVLALTGHLVFWHLVLAAVIIGSLGSLFNPSLQASLPALTGDMQTLQATNGLMDVTTRLARVLGPSLAGLLLLFMPLTQFFTLDALSFVASALAILSLSRHFFKHADSGNVVHPLGIRGIWQDIRGAIQLVKKHQLLAWTISANSLLNVAASMSLTIGIPLFVAQVLKSDVGTLGLIIGAYGIGNVLSNFVIGSLRIKSHIVLIAGGNLIAGSGFILLASTHSLSIALLGTAIAAIGGPMGDITMLTMMQTELPISQLGKIFSLRMVLANMGAALGLLIAIPFFQHVPIASGISLCGLAIMILGLISLIRFRGKDPIQRNLC